MLIAGNEVHIPPESDGFMPQTMLEHLNVRNLSWLNQVEALTQRYSNSLLEQFWGMYVSELKEFLLETPTHQQNLYTKLWALHNFHAKKFNPTASLVADKTPMLSEWMHWIVLACPQSQVIFLYRDLVDTVASRMKAFEEEIDVSFERYRLAWRAISNFEKKHPELLIKLRYEELLHRPKESITEICELTGLKYDESMLSPTEMPAGDAHLSHHEELQHPPHLRSIGKGYEQLNEKEIKLLRKWSRQAGLPKDLIRN